MSAKTSMNAHVIQRLHTVTETHIRGLADLLIDCVDGGASVSFMQPLPVDKAVDFWRHVAAAVAEGKRALLIAEDRGGPIGTVQLILDHCWYSTRQAATPSDSTRGLAGSAAA